MRKFLLLALSASMGSILTVLLLGLPLNVSAGAGGPLTDNRFCADADGNGRLDIGDAVNILNYLFLGMATPHCVAQDVSLDQFATREELQALREELQARPRFYSGSYIGDGNLLRTIETGIPGKIVALWIALVENGDVHSQWTIGGGTNSPTLQTPDGTRVSFAGANFVTDSTRFGDPFLNLRNKQIVWFALAN